MEAVPTTNYSYLRLSAVLTAMVAATLAAVVLVVASGFAGVQEASAANTITVNTAEDVPNDPADKCSLREAITNAEANAQTSPDCQAGSGADIIAFLVAPSSTIVLGSPLPNITDAAGLTIDGGSTAITISGNDLVGVFVEGPGAKLT